MKKSHKFNVKDKKLATKLSIFIGTLTIVIFFIMNFFSLTVSGKHLRQSIDREFTGMCNQNVLKIQNILDGCSSIANSTSDSLQVMYQSNDTITLSEGDTKAQYISKVNKQPLSQSRYDAENVLLNAIWSAVEDNEGIVGAGVFFEQNAFAKNIKEYAPYVMEENVTNRTVDRYTYSYFKNKDYYVDAKAKETMNFSDAYVDSNGIAMFSVSYPIIYNGQFKGIVLLDLKSDIFNIIDIKNNNYKSMYVNLLNNNNNILYSTHTSVIGKNFNETVDQNTFNNITGELKNKSHFSIETSSGKDKKTRFFTPINVGTETWWVQSALLSSEYNSFMSLMTIVMIVISVTSFVVLIVVMVILLKKMLKPVDAIVEAAKKIERGDLNIELEVKYQDEIGILSSTFNEMAQNLKTIIKDISYILNEMSKGNLQIESENIKYYVGDYKAIINGINTITMNLNSTLNEINIVSDQVNSGAEQVSCAAQALSQGATEQASSVEELSATMTEITDKIKHNAEKAGTANTLSQEAGNEVVISNQKMKEMSCAMYDIKEKSTEIGKIIKTIDDIAFQTNILALNAAVEAARAGSAGQGFTVVADEVRNLAQKSAEAAKNTTILIEDAVEAIENGSTLTEEAEKALIIVAEKTGEVKELINEISNNSQEQANGVEQVSLGIEQISAVVQTNSATSEESAAASEELSGQSNMLQELFRQFKLR
ncbi:HAMP domain-containing protein [Sedimentibacter sp. zth1]|uniref:methyl-accepting chemotaxis protein n=1 Tax=Sedimentibacter sp. zth1 TaxID=2816908 RepID=UPI001A9229E3|nr:methyl-accepting chemotaxis protein [Sedimentibacter sp. zth1]QSX04863.1 HAMP domain-containing protein [Sedimentibacter sp. zth1]